MGPEKRIIPISFAGGIDTKTDPKQVITSKLLDLQNGVFQQTGAINRRWGYKALGTNILGTATNIAAAFGLHAFNQELLLYDGLNAYSYIPATDNWAPRGGVVSVVESNQQVIANSSQQLSPDFGTLNGIEVYAWEDSRGGIRYSVRDATTEAFLVVDQPLYAGMASTIVRPKVIGVSSANAIAVFFVAPSGGPTSPLSYVVIPTANPTAALTPVTLFSDLDTSGPVAAPTYDVCVSDGVAYVIYIRVVDASHDAFLIVRLTGLQGVTWSKQANTFLHSDPGPYFVSVTSINGQPYIWFAYGGTQTGPVVGSVTVGALNKADGSNAGGPPANVLATVSGTLRSIGLVATTAGTATTNYLGGPIVYPIGNCFIEIQPTTGSANQKVYANSLDFNGNQVFAVNPPPVFARSVGLASKPFQYNNAIYVNVAYQSNQQSTYFTLDANGKVVAKVFPGLCGGLIQNSDSILPECAAIGTGIFKYANLLRGTVNTVAGQVVALLGVNATKLDFVHSNEFFAAPLNGCLHTVGGVLQTYDGSQYVEHGFHYYPEGIVYTPSASGGVMLSGTYNYAVTYEWVNNNNQTDISAPSVATSVTVTGPTGSVQLVIPTLRLTKKSKVKIVVYRTTAGGTILYRVSSALAPIYNDPTVDTITFTDTLADASITSNGALYTQPLNINQGNPVLPNSAPPSCSIITTFDDRVILSGLDDPYSWWPSQPAIPNAPAQFSSALAQRLDPDGGPITAMMRMDDKLVFFKSNAIFYISGTGPTPTGDGSQYTPPAIIPSGGVGCLSQNAVVLTPMGLMFQSANGIYLLDRALNVSYKGAQVEKYTSPNQLALVVNSATLIPNQWVIFTTSSGTALVYDYFYDQWSVFTNHQAADSDLYLGQGNVLAWAKTNGQVYLQTPTVFTDAGMPIVFDMTMLLQFAGLQGYQRIYELFLLGTYKGSGTGNHTLNAWGAFDFDDPFTAFALIPIDTAPGLSTFGSASPFGSDSPFGGAQPGQTVFQFRLDVVRKCQSMRLRLYDAQQAPGDEAFSLSALTARVGVKPKVGYKGVSGAKTFGVS